MWLETAETNTNISLECVFDGPGVAVRFCNQTLREWENPNLDDCNTELTQEFQKLGEVSYQRLLFKNSYSLYILCSCHLGYDC